LEFRAVLGVDQFLAEFGQVVLGVDDLHMRDQGRALMQRSTCAGATDRAFRAGLGVT